MTDPERSTGPDPREDAIPCDQCNHRGPWDGELACGECADHLFCSERCRDRHIETYHDDPED